ncbi:MAG TPA: hypothetical protein VNI83_09840 [Vicinamibacterales bacterium]|nr:hypothetical protein [Vicinamibacterales bacterium]
MTHPLLLGLFDRADDAARAATAAHALGLGRDRLSVVARDHGEEGRLARRFDATPGADIEDSPLAARLGELSARVLAAIALVLPGIGPIVAAGPLAAGLGEAAGHAAGDLGRMLGRAGVPRDRAEALEQAVEQGAVLLGIHARRDDEVDSLRVLLERHGGRSIVVARWPP